MGLRAALRGLFQGSEVPLAFSLQDCHYEGEVTYAAHAGHFRFFIAKDYEGADFMWAIEDAKDGGLVNARAGTGFKSFEHARGNLLDWLNSDEGRATVDLGGPVGVA